MPLDLQPTPLDLTRPRKLAEKFRLADKISLVFHGPFVFRKRADGIDVLVPSIDLHITCWGREPILKAEDVVNRFPLERGKRYTIPGLLGGAGDQQFDTKLSLSLPSGPKHNKQSPALYAVIELPFPATITSLRQRALAPKESYLIQAGNETVTISGATGQKTSRVQVLQFAATPGGGQDELVSIVHFHAEPLNESFGSVLDLRHDLDAVSALFDDIKIDLGPDFPDRLGANGFEAAQDYEKLFGPDGADHVNSLYELKDGGAGGLNCDSWVPGC